MPPPSHTQPEPRPSTVNGLTRDLKLRRGGVYCVEAARAEPLTGMRLNLFFSVTLCLLILSSGEKRAGWADMVMVVPTDFFRVYKRLPGWGKKGFKRGVRGWCRGDQGVRCPAVCRVGPQGFAHLPARKPSLAKKRTLWAECIHKVHGVLLATAEYNARKIGE